MDGINSVERPRCTLFPLKAMVRIYTVCALVLNFAIQLNLLMGNTLLTTYAYLPASFTKQVYVLTFISLSSVYAGLLINRSAVRYTALLLRIVSCLLVTHAVGEDLQWVTLHLVALLFDIYLLFPKARTIGIALLVIAAEYWVTQPSILWGSVRFGLSGLALLEFLGLGVMVSMLLALLQLLLGQAAEYQQFRLSHQGLVKRISQTNLHLQELAIRSGEEAKLKERSRIAADIHDIIGHTLVTIKMLVESAKIKRDDVEAVDHALDLIKMQCLTGMQDARSALNVLHHSDPVEKWTVNTIREMVRIFQDSTGVVVSLHVYHFPAVTVEVIYVLYRLVQEGLTNALFHGEATQVAVQLLTIKNLLYVTIRDNGKGCVNFVEGYGLNGMRRRIEKLGGQLSFDTGGVGFAVNANIPYTRHMLPIQMD